MRDRRWIRGGWIAAATVGLGLSPAHASALQGPESTDSLRIRFVGNAGVELTDGAVSILVDVPYEPGAFGYMTYDPASLAPPGQAVSLITHRHADHFDPGLFSQVNWRIVGPIEVTASLPERRVLPGVRHSVGEFAIQGFVTPHSDTEHYSYLVTWRGRRLYFVGDTEDPSQVLETSRLDVLFVTPWLACLIQEAGEVPDAGLTILYHQAPGGDDRSCLEPRVMQQGEVISLRLRSPSPALQVARPDVGVPGPT